MVIGKKEAARSFSAFLQVDGAACHRDGTHEHQARTPQRQIGVEESTRWLNALRTPRDVQEIELNGVVGSIAHLAYHLGAIRQINSSLRGPADTNAPSTIASP